MGGARSDDGDDAGEMQAMGLRADSQVVFIGRDRDAPRVATACGIASSSPVGARLFGWAFDIARGESRWSPGLGPLLGLAKESDPLSPDALLAIIHEEDRPRVLRAARSALSSTLPDALDFRIRMPTGELRELRLEGVCLAGSDGRPSEWVGTVADLTESKRAAALVARTLDEFESAQRVARMGSWTWSLTDDSIEWSQGMYDLLGLTGSEPASEQLFDQFVLPEDLDILMGIRRQIAGGDAIVQSEFRIMPLTGRVLTVAADVQAQRNSGGDVVGFRGVMQDVTRRKELAEQLRQSQKMEAVGTLAGGVAHDFNNYLMVISAHVEQLRASHAGSAQDAAALSAIGRACERCASLTHQLLTFSRKRICDPVVVDLAHLIERVDPMLRTVLGPTNSLIKRIDTSARVLIDPVLFEQALVNMALNARDAMPHGGTLTLTLEVVPDALRTALELPVACDRMVCLRVVDSGVGIAPEYRDRVFEPFFTTKDTGHGTGLGLATTYGIIEEAGGHISFESELGRGTAFSLYLPLAEAHAESAVPSVTLPPQRRELVSGTVLVVEDVAEVREVIARQLTLQGFQVITAEHGRAALEVLERRDTRIDVVLSDVVMPVMGGVELEQKLRASYPEIRCALMTGYAQHALGEEVQGTPLLRKPFRGAELVAVISELCATALPEAAAAGS